MSEDYTWDETVTAHGYAVQNAGLRRDNATLAARVMELETALREQCALGMALIAQRAELERENANLRMLNERIAHDELIVQQANEDLRARLDTVWDYARYYRAAMWELEQEDWRGEVLGLGEWIADGKPRAGTLQKTKRDWREQQPADDTDAPLTLAKLDEDGDE